MHCVRGGDGCIVSGRDRGRGWVHCEGEEMVHCVRGRG